MLQEAFLCSGVRFPTLFTLFTLFKEVFSKNSLRYRQHTAAHSPCSPPCSDPVHLTHRLFIREIASDAVEFGEPVAAGLYADRCIFRQQITPDDALSGAELGGITK
jgi:hypothetical protein